MSDFQSTQPADSIPAQAPVARRFPIAVVSAVGAIAVLLSVLVGVVVTRQKLARQSKPVRVAWGAEVSSFGEAVHRVEWQAAAPGSGEPASAPLEWLADARLGLFRGSGSDKPLAARPAVVPPEDRWEIEFDPGLTIGDYAKQLDALGVELAVVVDDDTLEYATKLVDSKPKSRRGARADESRLYLTWSRGDLVAADRVLLANAGIDAADRVVLHFLPEATHDRFLRLERQFAKRPLEKIAKTVFGLGRTFRGYELYVKRQQERK